MRRASPVAVAVLVSLLALGQFCAAQDKERRKPAPLDTITTPARTVQMVIDYGDGAQLRFTALPWKEKMTVLDALSAAGQHPHGVKAIVRGTGENAMIVQLGDLKNEGGGKTSRNWLFSVNDVESEVGAGAAQLKAADVVLWRYGVWDNNDSGSK